MAFGALCQHVVVGIQLIQLLQHNKLDVCQASLLIVGEIHLNALQLLALTKGIEGSVIHGAEHNARQVQRIQAVGQFGSLNPGSAKHLEGHGVAHTDRDAVKLAHDARH